MTSEDQDVQTIKRLREINEAQAAEIEKLKARYLELLDTMLAFIKEQRA